MEWMNDVSWFDFHDVGAALYEEPFKNVIEALSYGRLYHNYVI
jgi:hypothetical protein